MFASYRSKICTFFDVGTDLSNFGSAMNAMMMSPNFQAFMSPFIMSGGNPAVLNQLLNHQGPGGPPMFPNWPGMPQGPSKAMSQLWMINQANKVRRSN